MYVNTYIPWNNDEVEFVNLVNLAYKLGYQVVFINFKTKEEYLNFKNSPFFRSNPHNMQFPISIKSVLFYKSDLLKIPVIPRITLSPKTPNLLKQELSEWYKRKCIISVESNNKEILQIAARDGRVDMLSASTIEFQKTLSKGILSLARQNNCVIDFSLTPVLETYSNNRTRLFRVIYRLFMAAKPNSNLYTLGSNYQIKNNPFLLRGPVESMSILNSILKIPKYFTKKILSDNAESLILRYIKKDLGLLVESGVEIVDIKKIDS